jgi:hypothetical protein
MDLHREHTGRSGPGRESSRTAKVGTSAWPLLFAAILLVAGALGCGGLQVYNFGGEGRGQAFHVPAAAAMNESAIVQSWIAYSLTRSTCKLEIGGEQPSANHSYECELRPRRVLAKRWAERMDSPDTDAALDLMVRVDQAGLLEEYVWHYFQRDGWVRPEGLEMERFDRFRRAELGWHRPTTRLIGYWTSGRSTGLARTDAVR